jgi:hypothetical protein
VTSAATTADRRPPKLPFWRTVGRAYAVPFVSFGSLVRCAWLWLLVLAPVVLVLSWFQMPLRAESLAELRAHPGVVHERWQLWLLTTVQEVLTTPAMASIAVAWHRLVIAGERPAGLYLRLDRSVWLYAGFLLAWMLAATALSALPELLATEPASQIWAGVLLMVSLFAGGLVMGRLSLVLPPIALGRTDIGLGDAWHATRGNSWRLFWGPLVCVLLMVIPGFMVSRVVEEDRALATVVMSAFSLFALVAGVIAVGYLSFAYQHFFQNERKW